MDFNMIVGILLLGLFLIGQADGQTPPGQPQSQCAQSVDTNCGRTFGTTLQTAGQDIRRVCSAVDTMLACSAKLIENCDIVEAAEMTQGIKGSIVDTFGPSSPTRCQLNATSVNAFASDQCKAGMMLCFGVLKDGEAPQGNPPQVDLVRACLFYDGFTRCIQAELKTCSASVMAAVEEKSKAAADKFNSPPYTCASRQNEIKFNQECLDKLRRSVGSVDTSELCRLYQETKVCVNNVKASSTAQQAAQFDKEFNEFTEFLRKTPYFCDTENPCLTKFEECNATATEKPLNEPCDLKGVYDKCLDDTLTKCNPQLRQDTIEAVNVAKIDVDNKYLCGATVPPISASSKSAACDEVASVCSQGLEQGITEAQGDRTVICQNVDSLLQCVITKSSVCDPVSKVELIDAIGPVIVAYSDPQFTNCDLANAKNPVLTLDACDVAIANCSRSLFAAETTDDSTENGLKASCALYEKYIQCSRAMLSLCNPGRQTAINEYVTNSTRKFNAEPYYCEERERYEIGPSEDKFLQCQTNFQTSLASNSDKYDAACRTLQTFDTCLDTARAKASPRQVTNFDTTYLILSEPMLDNPYFCTAENPCTERYKLCRQQLLDTLADSACSALSLLDTCITRIRSTCTPIQLLSTTTFITDDKSRLDRQYGCSGQSPFVVITTPATTTTTSTITPKPPFVVITTPATTTTTSTITPKPSTTTPSTTTPSTTTTTTSITTPKPATTTGTPPTTTSPKPTTTTTTTPPTTTTATSTTTPKSRTTAPTPATTTPTTTTPSAPTTTSTTTTPPTTSIPPSVATTPPSTPTTTTTAPPPPPTTTSKPTTTISAPAASTPTTTTTAVTTTPSPTPTPTVTATEKPSTTSTPTSTAAGNPAAATASQTPKAADNAENADGSSPSTPVAATNSPSDAASEAGSSGYGSGSGRLHPVLGLIASVTLTVVAIFL